MKTRIRRKTFHSILHAIVLFLPLLVQAQEIPEMPHRHWRDTATRRLYWNKHLPVYLLLSPSPSGANAEMLSSEEMPQWSMPFYFDTEGINFMRTRSAVDTTTKKTIQPEREILWEVYADGEPPVTTLSYEKVSNHSKKAPFMGIESRCILKARDGVSGVHSIYYTIDNKHYTQYTTPFQLTTEGEVMLRYFAFDQVGNREKLHEQQLVADFTPPRSKSIVTGVFLDRENTIAPSSKMYIEAADAISSVAKTYYRIDSTEWREYPHRSTISLAKLADGRHTLQFYSVDVVDNQEAIQSFPFYLDASAPITISDILGDRFIVGDKTFFSGRTKLKITAVDNHSGVKEVLYSINGGEFIPYSEPFYLPNTQGWHTVKYFSIDSTENRTTGRQDEHFYEYRMKVDKIYVDLTGPTITHSLSGPSFTRNDTVFVSPATTVTLRGEDPESGLNRLAFSIDRDAWEKLYEAPFNLQGLSSGEHQIEYFGYDNVENRNKGLFTFILDSDPPNVNYHLSIAPYENRSDSTAAPIFPKDATVYLTAQDNMTGIARLQYSLNGKPKTNYTKAFGNLEKGKNRLTIYAEDMVGNTKEFTISFEVR